ncbi:hypothetical protein V5F49_03760 [Xanthobacter sp. V3C-3]|uniref:hypothetical protein n=1 Tax=Xanthobacter lutulentifluminis TaxID=3119935 RepID=UPI0037299074
MSHASVVPPVTDRCGPRHCLQVEAEPQVNLMMRLLEPLVVHDVLPERIVCTGGEDALGIEIVFAASTDVAERLRLRLGGMMGVRSAAIAPAGASLAHPAAASRAA